MAHHRNAALGQERDGLGHAHAAFELDRAAAGFLHDPRGTVEGLLARSLVGAERHIDHDQRALRAAHHRLPLQDHHLERDRHGRFQAVHHHAERVANQDEVAMLVDQARRMRVIGGERDDRLAALARADIRRGDPLDLVLDRHGASVAGAGQISAPRPRTASATLVAGLRHARNLTAAARGGHMRPEQACPASGGPMKRLAVIVSPRCSRSRCRPPRRTGRSRPCASSCRSAPAPRPT